MRLRVDRLIQRRGRTRDQMTTQNLKSGTKLKEHIKRAHATAAIGGDRIKNLKLGLEDLVALFRPGREDEDE
jgi:hypothetical protein